MVKMFTCTACTRRCLRAIAGDAVDGGVLRLFTLQQNFATRSRRSTPWLGKRYASVSPTEDPLRQGEDYDTGVVTALERAKAENHAWQEPFKQTPEEAAKTLTGSAIRGVDQDTRSRDPATRLALEKDLRFLKDPLKLAENTVQLLHKGETEKAYDLVKLSSRNMACTVSWNHLMDYEMAKKRAANALKIYNDMKKRGQLPDSYTFTILLRGLGSVPQYSTALERALSLYHSMYAPNCPVKPRIIHTNAVLKVCARAGDLDALWGVAARLPSKGPSAPDKATFTTIFNAIARIAQDNAYRDDLNEDEKADRRQKSVLQGRRIWADIIERWREGDIMIDEDLVCSMGRLLVFSEVPKDIDDVLSLIEQTMGIRRKSPPLAPGKLRHAPKMEPLPLPPPAYDGNETERETTDAVPVSDPEHGPFAAVDDDFVPGQEFDFVPSSGLNPAAYVKPGLSTLSLVINACTRLHNISAAQDYWGLLTGDPYNLSPDKENYHMYLRLLRVQRASRDTVALVQEMKDGLGVGPPVPSGERRAVKREEGGGGGRRRRGQGSVEAKTFRIALSTCKRDINNPNVLAHASKLCRMMIDSLETPDIRTLELFLDIGFRLGQDDWRTLNGVLRGTELGIRNLRSHLQYSEWRRRSTQRHILHTDIRNFLQRLLGAYGFLLGKFGEHFPRREYNQCQEQRNTIAMWETKLGRLEGDIRGEKLVWKKDGETKKEEDGRAFVTIRGVDGERTKVLGRRDPGIPQTTTTDQEEHGEGKGQGEKEAIRHEGGEEEEEREARGGEQRRRYPIGSRQKRMWRANAARQKTLAEEDYPPPAFHPSSATAAGRT